MSKSWEGGTTYAWKVLRKQILEANAMHNRGRCTLGIPGTCSQIATQVHHTVGKAVTGDDPRYLAAVCKPCNQAVGDPQRHKDRTSQPLPHWS